LPKPNSMNIDSPSQTMALFSPLHYSLRMA
jgi:hypothetical protein